MTFHVQRTVSASQASAGRPVCSMPAFAGDAALRLGRTRPRRVFVRQRDREAQDPSLRPRSSASTRCDGTLFTGSLALK